MLLTLYDSHGNAKARIEPDDSSTQDKEIQGDNLLKLSFTLYEFVPFDVNDYVDYCGERYRALERYVPSEKSSVEWDYNVLLYGVESLIKRFLVLNLTDGDGEAVFSLTARPAEHVRLIVANINAGMGGKVFQDALVRTSELLGTGAQNAINMYGSFRESLTRGQWLTTEVLTETLKQFAGAYTEADLVQQGFTEAQAKEIAQMAQTAEDAATKVKTFTQLWDTLKESAQSGWTSTWEILVGDFEEAKELLTEISNTIGGVISESAQARNELLSGGLSSGWKQLLDQGIADEAGFIESIQTVAREKIGRASCRERV